MPGANITEIFGVNNKGHVVGQYFSSDPLAPGESGFARIHGFIYDGETYRTIDFPGDFTVTALLGINNRGLIVGAFFDFDPDTNAAGPWHFFSHDNGQFTPLSFPGTNSSFIIDMNKHAQAIGIINIDNQDGPSFPESASYFLFDDGVFLRVTLPETTEFSNGFPVTWDVTGMNDDGQLVGRYFWVGECSVPPGGDRPVCVGGGSKGFIATPQLPQLAHSE